MNEESTNQPSAGSPETMRNIVLIGFMGCGKSTIGWELHKSLGYPFVDTDQAIEKEQGRKIKEIFKTDGETAFRQMETAFLKKLIKQKTHRTIIATGGGIITTPENIPLLQKLGFVVWLTCLPEVIYNRTSRNSNRPLLQCPDPQEAIRTLLDQRKPLYDSCANLKIDTSELNINEIKFGILESARYHFGISDDSK